MESRSASSAIKLVDGQIYLIERGLNFRLLSKKERDNLAQLHQNLHDARLYAADHESSESEDDRAKNRTAAHKWLGLAQKRIVTASQTDIFEPADVAQLSAQIEQIMSEIK